MYEYVTVCAHHGKISKPAEPRPVHDRELSAVVNLEDPHPQTRENSGEVLSTSFTDPAGEGDGLIPKAPAPTAGKAQDLSPNTLKGGGRVEIRLDDPSNLLRKRGVRGGVAARVSWPPPPWQPSAQLGDGHLIREPPKVDNLSSVRNAPVPESATRLRRTADLSYGSQAHGGEMKKGLIARLSGLRHDPRDCPA
jgi:hypothetical protein